MVYFNLLTIVYNILTHKTTTFITFILLRPVKGGCCISKDIDFGLLSRLNTISEKLRKSPVGVYSFPLYVTGI